MRVETNFLLTTSLVVLASFAAVPAQAVDVEATSVVEAVTVYPDGASVTRAVTVEMPSGTTRWS